MCTLDRRVRQLVVSIITVTICMAFEKTAAGQVSALRVLTDSRFVSRAMACATLSRLLAVGSSHDNAHHSWLPTLRANNLVHLKADKKRVVSLS